MASLVLALRITGYLCCLLQHHPIKGANHAKLPCGRTLSTHLEISLRLKVRYWVQRKAVRLPSRVQIHEPLPNVSKTDWKARRHQFGWVYTALTLRRFKVLSQRGPVRLALCQPELMGRKRYELYLYSLVKFATFPEAART